mgnify:FL=1
MILMIEKDKSDFLTELKSYETEYINLDNLAWFKFKVVETGKISRYGNCTYVALCFITPSKEHDLGMIEDEVAEQLVSDFKNSMKFSKEKEIYDIHERLCHLQMAFINECKENGEDNGTY